MTKVLHLFMGDIGFQGEVRRDETAIVLRVPYLTANKKEGDMTPQEVQRFKTILSKVNSRNYMINNLVVNLAGMGRNVIVLSDRIAHLEQLQQMFIHRMGETASQSLFVGSMKRVDRENASEFAQILFASVTLAQEGLDIPRLDTLILACPMNDVTQAVGRILRPYALKKPPVVIDIVDDMCTSFILNASRRESVYRKLQFDLRAPCNDASAIKAILGIDCDNARNSCED
jgi:superfamily II DNA or RNA helicase